MNIKQAKNEIQNAMKAYFSKDKFGNYVIPYYDTAFVFIDDDFNNYEVPPWAIKLVLQRNEI